MLLKRVRTANAWPSVAGECVSYSATVNRNNSYWCQNGKVCFNLPCCQAFFIFEHQCFSPGLQESEHHRPWTILVMILMTNYILCHPTSCIHSSAPHSTIAIWHHRVLACCYCLEVFKLEKTSPKMRMVQV